MSALNVKPCETNLKETKRERISPLREGDFESEAKAVEKKNCSKEVLVKDPYPFRVAVNDNGT